MQISARKKLSIKYQLYPKSTKSKHSDKKYRFSTPERLMDHQPATEDPRSRPETRRPVETTARTVGSGNGRPVTHLKQSIGQCPSGKRTSVRCCVPGVGSGRGGRAPDGGRMPILRLGM